MATNQDNRAGSGSTRDRSSGFETHPLYAERLEDWIQMEDCYAGSRRIKDKGFTYLPATPGQRADGLNPKDQGYLDYCAYRKRAIFHDVVKEAVQAMVGVMHRKPATFELPAKLQAMIEKATPDGESLEACLRAVNVQQLLNARVGLLAEAPTGKTIDKAIPFLALYAARSIINWDTGISDQGERRIELVALDESAWERQNTFNWEFVEKTRLLMSDPTQLAASPDPGKPGYWFALLRDGRTDPVAEDFKQPQIGGRTLDRVPFVFINANDLVPDPETPPLLGLSEIALALYRGDADYRQTLFMTGQETLVISGGGDSGDTTVRTGVGATIDLPKGGDAKYIGVSGIGLDHQEKAIDKLLQIATERGSKLLEVDSSGSSEASGEALRVRVAARTTTLVSIAKTGALGMQTVLRMCAEWVGANPEEVNVTPNLEFADQTLTAQDLTNFVTAKNGGLPLSWKSVHNLLVQNDMTNLTFEEEQDEIESEGPLLGAANQPILDPVTGEPMLHPVTGKPLAEPMKRGATMDLPNEDGSAGPGGSKKPAKGAKKTAQANKNGKGGQS